MSKSIVLHTEDSDLSLSLGTALEDQGYDICRVSHRSELVVKVSENTPDLAIIDLNPDDELGFVPGDWFWDVLEQVLSGVRVLVLNGFPMPCETLMASAKERAHARQSGSLLFVEKSISYAELFGRVERLISASEKEEEISLVDG